jgi:hypothetical protein
VPRRSIPLLHSAKAAVRYNRPAAIARHALITPKFRKVGCSAYGGQAPPALGLRGSVDAALPAVASLPFLTLNPGVIERGQRLLGSVHGAYYFRGLSLLGECQYGYATTTRADPVVTLMTVFRVAARQVGQRYTPDPGGISALVGETFKSPPKNDERSE